MNVTEHLERANLFFPDNTAVVFEGKNISYGEFNENVNRIGNALKELGITKGERVGIFLPNIPEFLLAYQAILKIGAIAVSLNSMLKKDEIKYIVNDCKIAALFTTQELFSEAKKAQAETPSLNNIIICEGEAVEALSLASIMSKVSANLKAMDMDREDVAAIIYTSGTTGKPKGAMLTHANIVSNTYTTVRLQGYTPADKLLLFLPLFHVFGQNAIFNTALQAGSTLVLQRRFDLEATLKLIKEAGVTAFFGVPTIYIMILNSGCAANIFETVRFCFSAAATMPVEIAKKWYDKFKLKIYEGYGLTETSPISTYNHQWKHKFGSIGTPVDNVEVKIFNENDEEVPVGEPGEIVVRGPNVMKGYYGKEEDTAKCMRNGWFHTGDIGRMDEAGYFYIVDRVKDMINASGFKVFPREVEELLYLHDAVKEAAVVGIPDPIKGEAVKAYLTLQPGKTVTPTEIIMFCRERIAVYKVPQVVEIVAELPKSGTGKILKRVLRDDK